MNGQESEELRRLIDEVVANPTVDNYLALRNQFPNCDVATDRFCTIESLANIHPELVEFGINPMTVAGVLDGEENDMDALSLHLLEHLLQRQQMVDRGTTHSQRRRVAIPDSLVDYLVVMMLGVCDAQRLAPPSSLVFLTRERLGGSSPARYAKQKITEKRSQAIIVAAQSLARGEQISSREIARMIGVEPSTVSRWFSPKQLAVEAERFRDLFDDRGNLVTPPK